MEGITVNSLVRRLKTRVVGAALASTLVVTAGVVVVGSAIAASQTMVTTANVNLRSGPGTNYAIVGVLNSGDRVSATGSAVSGQSSIGSTWTPVIVNGRSGYVATAYLKAVADTGSGGSATGAAANAVANTDVNVRTGPGTSYSIVTQFAAGTPVQTTGVTSGGWTQIVYEGADRWLFSEYITLGSGGTGGSGSTTTNAQVRTTDVLYLRAEGYFGATIIGKVPADSVVDVTGETTDAYTQVVYQGQTGWIASRYTVPVTTAAYTYSDSTLTSQQAKLVDYVKSKVGDAYVWAAAGPDAFDCSGLTMMAYTTVGISLPHYSGAQATLGTAVSRADLQPGDLIFWYSPVSHVSLYIGGGMMVHARNVAVGVVEQSVDSYIAEGGLYVGARRFLS